MPDLVTFSGLEAAMVALGRHRQLVNHFRWNPELWWADVATILSANVAFTAAGYTDIVAGTSAEMLAALTADIEAIAQEETRRGVFNVLAYGDTNTHTEIQAAINAAEAYVAAGSATRAVVLIPAGTYTIGTKLTVDDDGVHVVCERGAKLIRDTSAGLAVILDFNAGATTLSDVGLWGGIIDGAGVSGFTAGSVDSNGIGVRFANCSGFSCVDVTAQNCRSTSFLFTKGSGTVIQRGHVARLKVYRTGDTTNTNDPAIEPDGVGLISCVDSTFDQIYVYNTVSGGNGFTFFQGCARNSVSNLIVDSVEAAGIAMDAASGTGNHEYNTLTNVYIRNSQAPGFRVVAQTTSNLVRYNTISNLVVEGATSPGSPPGHGIHLNADAADKIVDNTFTNVVLEGNSDSALAINRVKRCRVQGLAIGNGAYITQDSASDSQDNDFDLLDPSSLPIQVATVAGGTPVFPKYKHREAHYEIDGTHNVDNMNFDSAWCRCYLTLKFVNASPGLIRDNSVASGNVYTSTGSNITVAQTDVFRVYWDGTNAHVDATPINFD